MVNTPHVSCPVCHLPCANPPVLFKHMTMLHRLKESQVVKYILGTYWSEREK